MRARVQATIGTDGQLTQTFGRVSVLLLVPCPDPWENDFMLTCSQDRVCPTGIRVTRGPQLTSVLT